MIAAPNDIAPGRYVKRRFIADDGTVERMWVRVTHDTPRGIVGILSNGPAVVEAVEWGDEVEVMHSEILDDRVFP